MTRGGKRPGASAPKKAPEEKATHQIRLLWTAAELEVLQERFGKVQTGKHLKAWIKAQLRME